MNSSPFSKQRLLTVFTVIALFTGLSVYFGGMGGQAGGDKASPKKVRVLVADRISFDINKARVKRGQAAVVELMADYLSENSDLTVTVEGHADPTEKEPSALSQARATAVHKALIKAGVAVDRLDIRPFGASKPATKSNKESSDNRRVEFRVIRTLPAH